MWYEHKTCKNYSVQLNLDFWILTFNPFKIVLFTASTCPCVCGCSTKVKTRRILCAKSLNCIACKPSSIRNNHGSRDSKLAYGWPPNEFFDMIVSDFSHQFHIHPFGEIVHSHNQVLQLSYHDKKWSKNVDSILIKRPCRWYRM